MIAPCPRAVPREGLDAPVFDGMGAEDHLIVSLSFAPALTDQQMHVVYRWLRTVECSPDRVDSNASPFDVVEPFVHEQLFHVRVGNLADPRAVVRSLIDDLTAAGVRIKDSFYARWGWRPDGVMGPCPDPRAPRGVTGFANARELLDQLWDFAAEPPASELESDLKGGFIAQDELILEHRGTPLFFPGFRIAYGTVPFLRVPADERTEQVRRVLIESIIDGWRTLYKAPGKGHSRPQPLAFDGSLDRIDRIECGTRVGYLFTIEAVQLLDRPSPATCRFREYELMEAVLETVTKQELAPVVTWQRYGTTVMTPIKCPEAVAIQLWEVGGDHRGHPGLDESPPLGQAEAEQPAVSS